jgi:hypothetical protein
MLIIPVISLWKKMMWVVEEGTASHAQTQLMMREERRIEAAMAALGAIQER